MTLFIGANDLCSDCDTDKPYTLPDIYEKELMTILEKVRTNLPNTFVNLIGIFNLSGVYEAGLSHFYCKDIHRLFAFECDCILQANNTVARQVVDQVGQEINQRLYNVQEYYANKYPNKKRKGSTHRAETGPLGQQLDIQCGPVASTTAVQRYNELVVQPFGINTNISALPIDFLSTLDCFHPSLLAHQTMAVALWNNMLNPMANKQNYINVNDQPLCPTADTLLYTY